MAILAIGVAVAADGDKVPLYTSEDLDRMFGPPPAGPSVPVDKSHPDDWNNIERFLDREYARIDADRQHTMNVQQYDQSAPEEDPSRMYGSMLWGGYYGDYYGGYYGGGSRGGRGNDCGSRSYDRSSPGFSSRVALARATGGYGRHGGGGGGYSRGDSSRGGRQSGGGNHAGHHGGGNRGGHGHGAGRSR